MNIQKRFPTLVMSLLLLALLAACGGGPDAASTGNTPTTAAPTSAPTTAPTSVPTTAPTHVPPTAPTTGKPQGKGGCTSVAECQAAVVTLTPKKVKAGGKVTMTVKGWMANTKTVASIDVDARQGVLVADIAAVTTDAQGNLTATFTIYSNISPLPITADIHIGQDQSGNNPINTNNDLTVAGGLTISK